MKLVDKENNLSGGIFHFFHHCLETFFEFTAEFCPGNEQSKVKRKDFFILHRHRYLSKDDLLRQTFRNCRLSYAGFTDKHRIVLSTTRENLNHTLDFRITTNDRVDLIFLGELSEVACVF